MSNPTQSDEATKLKRECQISDTRELFADFAKQRFFVITPRTEAAALPRDGEFTGKHLRGRARKGMANIAAITLDGKSLADANRLLVLHVSDTKQKTAFMIPPT